MSFQVTPLCSWLRLELKMVSACSRATSGFSAVLSMNQYLRCRYLRFNYKAAAGNVTIPAMSSGCLDAEVLAGYDDGTECGNTSSISPNSRFKGKRARCSRHRRYVSSIPQLVVAFGLICRNQCYTTWPGFPSVIDREICTFPLRAVLR
jgi:hypothetical protein